jgi:hypothetical protein
VALDLNTIIEELRVLAQGLEQSALFLRQTAGTLQGLAEALEKKQNENRVL